MSSLILCHAFFRRARFFRLEVLYVLRLFITVFFTLLDCLRSHVHVLQTDVISLTVLAGMFDSLMVSIFSLYIHMIPCTTREGGL